MKTRTFSSVGALHPILFFITVYAVALFMSIFICSSIFYSLNGDSSNSADQQAAEQMVKLEKSLPIATAVVLR